MPTLPASVSRRNARDSRLGTRQAVVGLTSVAHRRRRRNRDPAAVSAPQARVNRANPERPSRFCFESVQDLPVPLGAAAPCGGEDDVLAANLAREALPQSADAGEAAIDAAATGCGEMRKLTMHDERCREVRRGESRVNDFEQEFGRQSSGRWRLSVGARGRKTRIVSRMHGVSSVSERRKTRASPAAAEAEFSEKGTVAVLKP